MAVIGNSATQQAFTPAVDYFSGNGSTTAFTLSRPVASVAQVEAVIDNVVQNPSSAYTVSSNTITFTSAPLSGTNNIYVRYTSPITQVIAPGQGTVNTTALGNITNIASGNSSLTLQTGSGNTTAVTIDTSQNVGIGVTPSAWGSGSTALQLGNGAIWKSGSRSVDWITNGYYNGTNYIYNTSNAATYYRQYDGQHIWANAPSGTAGNAITYTQAMTLDSSGNVGIGTSSPATKLHVYTATGQNINYIETAGSGNDAGIYFKNTARTWSTFVNGGDGAYRIYDNTASTERMRIDSSGSLMIGTTSPGGRLTVAGPDSSGSNNALYVKNSNSNALFYVRDDGWLNLGNASVSPYNNTTPNGANMYIATDSSVQRSTSSLKYKKNIVNARYGLADVLKLRAVNYQSKNEFDGDKVFGGLIAEEVDEAGLTEFVQYAEDGTPDALAYGQMVALCVKSIQELKALVDAQATEIAELKAKVGV